MINDVVRAACKAIFDGRFYPTTFVQKDAGLPRWPAGRFTIVDAQNAGTVCGTDDETTDDTRVQIDIVADTRAEMVTLTGQVITAMMNLDPPCIREGKRETFDVDTRTYRTILEYTFHASSEVAS